MNNNEILLLKLGEVVLKGLNRRSFEDKLVSNVRRRMKPCGSFQIYIRQSTIYVEPQTEDCDMEAAFKAARQVFGIVTVARAVPCAKEMDAIVETAKTYLADEFARARTFKVESRRADKQFPMNSIQISQYVGGELGQFFNVKADMHHPDLTVYVEIREKYAYIHTPSVPGAGGLPIGMGGRAVSLLSGGLDSPVSSYMIARRGVELEMVHFVSPPYTSQQALDKVLELDSRFHTQIANAAQNPMLATITEYITRLTLPSRLETTRKVLAKGEEEIERFVELHRQLLSVIERRQVDEIAATVQDHYIFWKK